MKVLGAVKHVIKRILYLSHRHFIYRFEKNKKFSLDCSLWGLKINKNGHLMIGGCDCIELAKEYGTPIHVVDKKILQDNYNDFCESFKSNNINFEVFYSYKTNPVPGILKVLHDSGAGAEVISPYELWLAFKLGVNPSSIIYNGPDKSDQALKVAIENKIKLININSFNEIERIRNIAERLRTQVNIGVRLSTSVGWADQFGLPIQSGEAFKAFERLSEIECMNIEAVHMHLGSGFKNTFIYKKAIEDTVCFLDKLKNKLGIRIKYLDLGGGFGVSTTAVFSKFESRCHRILNRPCSPPDINNTPNMAIFAKKIVSTVRIECEKLKVPLPSLIFEPGRIITGSAQILLANVGDLKEDDAKCKFAILNAGINIAQPATSEYHEIFVSNKMNASYKNIYRIVGPICMVGDILYSAKKLPELNVGDVVAIMDSGAYFVPLSNNFSFPRPAVIMVSNGDHSILREGESYEEMARLDNL
ncbi:MAG: hypothetical protein ABSB18_07250 [Candidatus Omnitrophota bacterium]